MSAEEANHQQQVAEQQATNGERQEPRTPSAIKRLYRSAYDLCKWMEAHRRSAHTIADLFSPAAEKQRLQLAKYADKLLFQSSPMIARKAREILWRKVYYEHISAARRHLATWNSTVDTAFGRAALYELLAEAIATYKQLVLRLNHVHKLDLAHLVDLRLCKASRGSNSSLSRSPLASSSSSSRSSSKSSGDGGAGNGGVGGGGEVAAKHQLELISFALETVHTSLISLGDLHRYAIDLHFERAVSRDQAARFYCDAFALNTKIGMPQNQMGNLYAGLKCDLDTIYYYLYALICPAPFELAEPNVEKLFQANEADLQELVLRTPTRNRRITFAAFMIRFKRVAQIGFYDTQLDGELASLGHPLVANLRDLLNCTENAMHAPELNADGLFKMIAIMLFGVQRLQAMPSPTVHVLNALIVAICSELVDCANASVAELLEDRRQQVAAFAQRYGQLYDVNEQAVRLNREAMKAAAVAAAPAQPVQILGNRSVRPQLPLPQPGATSSSSGSGSSAGAVRSTTTAVAAVAHPPPAPVARPEPVKKKSSSRRRRARYLCDDEDSDADFGSSSGDEDEEEEEESTSSVDDSDYELDSNFSSEEDDEDLVTAYERKLPSPLLPPPPPPATANGGADAKSCDSDTSIEGEHFVYPNGTTAEPLESLMRQVLHVAEATEQQQQQTETSSASPPPALPTSQTPPLAAAAANQLAEDQLRYKRRYYKPDPNVIVDYARDSVHLRAIKILFDWLAANMPLLTNCHATNPEFLDKIMDLINTLNIDIFTRKVFFDQSLFNVPHIRADMERLFAERSQIPLAEDRLLKDFALLAGAQTQLDWEYPLREALTANEEHVLRMSKLVDFGFVISKSKLFGWRFCARARRFMRETAEVKGAAGAGAAAQGRNGGGKGWERGGRGDNGGGGGGGRRHGTSAAAEEMKRARRRRKRAKRLERTRETDGGFGPEFYDAPVVTSANGGDNNRNRPARSYQRSRQRAANGGGQAASGNADSVASTNTDEFPALGETVGAAAAGGAQPSREQIMGRLWLRAEVSALEAQDAQNEAAAATATWATPFLVVDALALTVSGGQAVRQLMRTKRFIVLVPTAVLGELDAMKRYSETARFAIRWLDQEITKGNRYMRMQRSYETEPVSVLRSQKKLEREDNCFVQIAELCNYMQARYADETGNSAVTLLTGDDLATRPSGSSPPLDYAAIMATVAVPFASVGAFLVRVRNNK